MSAAPGDRRSDRPSHRRLVVRRASDVGPAVARRASDAVAGELRLTAASGEVAWTDLVRIARWDGTGLPEETPAGLWRGENVRSGARDRFLAAVDAAVAMARRSGLVRPSDALLLVQVAERCSR